MKGKKHAGDDTVRPEKIFDDFLKLPGSRKAHKGAILESPEGTFHLLGFSKNDESLPQEAQFYLSFCTPKEAKRVLKIANATDYLLKKQADAIADQPRQLRRILAAKDEWLERGRSWSLGSYYNSLNKDGRSYVSALPKKRRRTFSKLVYGRAPLPQPNGVCLRSLVGDVVIVSDSLHYFFYYTALANLGRFYGLSVEQRAHAFLISLRIMVGVESLDFDLDPRENLPPAVKSEVLSDVGWMMQFTFGHEFSHFSLGHLDADAENPDSEVSFAHGLEFEADAEAVCGTGVSAFRAGKLAWAAQQVFLSFYTLQLTGVHRSDFPTFSISKTHPSPIDRLLAVQELDLKQQPVGRDVLDEAVEGTESFTSDVMKWISGDDRVFERYGSVYIPGFGCGGKVDRIDF